jgi:hypothetical protein
MILITGMIAWILYNVVLDDCYMLAALFFSPKPNYNFKLLVVAAFTNIHLFAKYLMKDGCSYVIYYQSSHERRANTDAKR